MILLLIGGYFILGVAFCAWIISIDLKNGASFTYGELLPIPLIALLWPILFFVFLHELIKETGFLNKTALGDKSKDVRKDP